MLIGFSGRKKSGKTTLANELIDQGFQIASFAAALKEYVAKLYNWDIETLKNQVQKEEILKDPVYWNEDKCKELSEIIGEEIVWSQKNNVFYSRRDAMQYIGTEVLREHEPDFHINEFKKRYTNGDFVCDDVRFPNELELIKEINGKVYHIVRPYHWEYSNHSSEISLNRLNSDLNILNDKTLEDFKNEFVTLQQTKDGYQDKCKDNTKLINFNVDSAYWAGYIHRHGTIVPFEQRYVLRIKSEKESFKEMIEFLEIPTCQYQIRKGVGFYSVDIDNGCLIEDLKLWSVDDKHENMGVVAPELINSLELGNSWIKGKGKEFR